MAGRDFSRLPVVPSPTMRRDCRVLFLCSLVGVDPHLLAAGSRLTLNGARCRFQVVKFHPFGRCDSCTRDSPKRTCPLTARGRPYLRLPFCAAIRLVILVVVQESWRRRLEFNSSSSGSGACRGFRHRTCRVAVHYQSNFVSGCDPGHSTV